MPSSNYGDRNRRGQEKRPKFRFSIIFLIMILSFAGCFVVYVNSSNDADFSSIKAGDLSSSATENSLPADESSAEVTAGTTETTTEATTTEATAANPVPANETSETIQYLQDNCVFVGDSLTVGLASYGYLPQKNVIASVGMNIDSVNTDTLDTAFGNTTVVDAVYQAKPSIVYIMLGSNGVSWMSNETMLERYKTLVDNLKAKIPDIKIYVMSIPPVTTAKETAGTYAVKNSDIDAYNSALLQFANDNGLYYVDVNTALKNNEGRLSEDMAAKDGMHFNKSTYQIMLDYILSHTVKD